MSDDARYALQQFLQDNGLPLTLMSFIENALANNMPFEQVVAELRQTPEYKAAYPENALRMENGYDWWPESQIRAYRAETRRLALEYMGVSDITDSEIAGLIANNKSLNEWEKQLVTMQSFERYGEVVGNILSAELGFPISDERLFAFMSAYVPTPELERAYEMALLRGQPAALGLGVRPEEEAELLRQFGIDPAQAFKGYQGVVGELPRTERLAMIEAEINRNGNFPTTKDIFADTPFSDVFRAIQLNDPEALMKLRGLVSRETARFQAQGGTERDREGASIGLLSRAER
jgi:hypothetical protein